MEGQFHGAKGIPGSYGNNKTEQFRKIVSKYGKHHTVGMNRFHIPNNKTHEFHKEMAQAGFEHGNHFTTWGADVSQHDEESYTDHLKAGGKPHEYKG